MQAYITTERKNNEPVCIFYIPASLRLEVQECGRQMAIHGFNAGSTSGDKLTSVYIPTQKIFLETK
jgi:hypothetical protein